MLAAGGLALAHVAFAGETECRRDYVATSAVRTAAHAARRLEAALDASAASFALIARVGSDVSRYGLHYTHAAFVWRDDPAGRWTVRHELNECAGPTSRLYRQGLLNFFLDEPFTYESLVLTVRPEFGNAILERIRSGAAERMHWPAYSSLANPYVPRYQNSNQYILENLALAHARMVGRTRKDTRADAIAELRQSGFRPSNIQLGFMESIVASQRTNVRLDDRPPEARSSLEVVTVESIEGWLSQNGLLLARRVVLP